MSECKWDKYTQRKQNQIFLYSVSTFSEEKRKQGHPEDWQETSTNSYRGEVFTIIHILASCFPKEHLLSSLHNLFSFGPLVAYLWEGDIKALITCSHYVLTVLLFKLCGHNRPKQMLPSFEMNVYSNESWEFAEIQKLHTLVFTVCAISISRRSMTTLSAS